MESTAMSVLTPGEVMQIFKISRPTFGDWCRKGIFQKVSIPGRRRTYVTKASVDKLLQTSKPVAD
ncbi:helix-turn-helix domain-containing protein [Chryseolinea sp. T2]|uniref:helix-turn-helix domain-containing protein n=1 Tax=Chryseolinea sp. T2 TaxID=3129255 RepID=UPI0030783BD4